MFGVEGSTDCQGLGGWSLKSRFTDTGWSDGGRLLREKEIRHFFEFLS